MTVDEVGTAGGRRQDGVGKTGDAPAVGPGYDLVSRSLLCARAIEALRLPAGPLLDVGGAEGLTAAYVGGRRTVVSDLRPRGADLLASGARLPFPDGAFAAVVALDVLEHVAPGEREVLLAEMMRVARSALVLAGPFDDPLVRGAESRQRGRFEALFGTENPWLAEHAAMGLPDLSAACAQLEAGGYRTWVGGSNPLDVWEAEQELGAVAVRVGAPGTATAMRRYLLDEVLDRADATEPAYRRFVVATRRGDPAAAAAVMPGTDAPLVEQAVQRLRVATWRMLGQALDDRASRLARGWAETAERVRELERAIAAAPPEPTLDAYERLVLETRAWHADLDGPCPAANEGLHTMPSDAAYGDWLSKVPPVPVPRGGPCFSVVVPIYNPSAEHLAECLRSVRAQSYAHWELVLVDGSDTPHVAPITRRFSTLDDRVKVVRHGNEGIARNTNRGVAASRGEWIVFLDHDDALAPDALAAVAAAIAEAPQADFVYSDEDKIGEDGHRRLPSLKPGWSPHLLQCLNYITHLVAVRRDLFDAVEGVRDGFEGAQDYDFVLRATARACRVVHVPRILYHWRQHPRSTAADVSAKPEAHGAGRRALQQWADEHLPGGWVAPGPGPTSHRLRPPLRWQKVSIIVPFRDRPALTSRCVDAIGRCAGDLPFEVLLVSNRSGHPETEEAVDRWERLAFARVVRFDEPFNFQRLNNWAARQVDGELLLLLNNDTEPLHRGWLEALAEYAQRPEVGAVGARLFYPDGTVQHAGVAVGIGGLAEHPWAHLPPDAATPAGPSYWVRDVTAVTAACLMIRHEVFDTLGGFDERFVVCGGDVDLGIRLREAGYWNVMTPFARLVHHESATRRRDPPEGDVRESLRAYAPVLQAGDPFYNPNLTLVDTSCQLRGAELPHLLEGRSARPTRRASRLRRLVRGTPGAP